MNRKEYTVINLIAEYEGRIAEFKYAVSSALPEEKLRKKYGTELKRYEPFLYLTVDQGRAIMDSIRNNDKHLKRQKNTYDYFGYSDGATELRHVESIYIQSMESDPLEKLITEENEREWEIAEITESNGGAFRGTEKTGRYVLFQKNDEERDRRGRKNIESGMQCFPEACAQTPAEQDGCYGMIEIKRQMRSENKFADGILKNYRKTG